MPAPALPETRQLTLPQGFAVSGLLHALMAAPLLLAALLLPPPHPLEPKMLTVDLHSLLPESNDPNPAAASQAAPPPQAPPIPQPAPQPIQRIKLPKSAKPTSTISPVRVPGTPAPTSAVPITTEQPPQSSVQSQADQVLVAYVLQLKRKLKEAMAASQEVRKAGLDGIVTVGFTISENGRLITETLRVVRSSGSPVLDKNALAVVAATPLDLPPREISITVDMKFQN